MTDELNLADALELLEREKGINRFEVMDKLEESLATSYQEKLDTDNDLRVTIDRQDGRIFIYEQVLVSGDPENPDEDPPVYEERDVTPNDVSRTAAQAAKSVMIQIIRDAEREKIYHEYADRVGDIVTGTVQQSDSRYTLISLGQGVEAILPPAEQPRNERYDHNQRIKAYIIEVRKPSGANEQSIIVSRTHPGLIRRLFELEVPEIYDGIVEIKNVAREPGLRSKIAVSSREGGLDPVGACVGPKGSRVRMVVAELRGERIDVIPWDDDPSRFVANSLSPAKVSRVIADEDQHTATVIVPDDQLSLAIGKEGQNARLAAKLTGWRIDIKSQGQAVEQGIMAPSADGGHDDGHDGRCEAMIGEDGSIRCRNKAIEGSRFCRLHGETEEG
jgi:N utilization substance protein A